MLFSSAIFLFFYLPAFLIIYHITPRRWQNALLFGTSLLFYAWGEGPIVLVLLLSAGINFVAGRLVEAGQRRAGLLLSLVGSLSLLFYYKYTNFLVDSLRGFAEAFALPVASHLTLAHIALPIGISFYTFQGISYTLDIYWGRIRANRSFLDYGTYVAMFPHQIAGPIVCTYTYTRYKAITNTGQTVPYLTYNQFGGRGFAMYEFIPSILPNLYLHAEIENTNVQVKADQTGQRQSYGLTSPLVGVTYSQPISRRFGVNLTALYNLNYNDSAGLARSIYGSPFVLRLSFF